MANEGAKSSQGLLLGVLEDSWWDVGVGDGVSI